MDTHVPSLLRAFPKLHGPPPKLPRSTAVLLITAALLCGALLAGCGGNSAPAPADPPAADAGGGGAGDGEAGGAGLAPVTSRSDGGADPSAGTSVASGDEVAAPGLVLRLPESWQQQEPSSSMRLAQAAIPGDSGPGELTVFYFGPGGGGGVQANIDRWVGQVELDPGTEPQQGTFAVGAYQVTWVVARGTIKPSTMGVGPTEAQPGSALLGGVIEGNQGPWFVKVTGPADTLDASQDDFFSLLRSARIP
ncbi:MAG: hypothetical protein MI919_24220 [Holophagales bacterium]|nr:hypothetical protein [Holophagales bacterium]